MNSLLNVTAFWSWEAFFKALLGNPAEGSTGAQATSVIGEVMGVVTAVIWAIVGVVGLAAVIYAIWLGIQLARAEDQSKRDEAKKHLITVIIAVAVTLGLVVFFLHLLPAIVSLFQNWSDTATTSFIHF